MIHKMTKSISNKDAFGDIPRVEFFMMLTIQEYNWEQRKGGGPRLTVTRLAKEMEMTNPSTSKLLRVMEAKGYTQREQDDHDRRIAYISLTRHGNEVITKAEEIAVVKVAATLEKLGRKDAFEMMRIFNKLSAILQEENT